MKCDCSFPLSSLDNGPQLFVYFPIPSSVLPFFFFSFSKWRTNVCSTYQFQTNWYIVTASKLLLYWKDILVFFNNLENILYCFSLWFTGLFNEIFYDITVYYIQLNFNAILLSLLSSSQSLATLKLTSGLRLSPAITFLPSWFFKLRKCSMNPTLLNPVIIRSFEASF